MERMGLIWINEYMVNGSGYPVDCTVGLRSKGEAIQHGRRVSAEKGYCGFWVMSKPAGTVVDPIRVEFHPVMTAPSGKVTFGKVVSA